MDTEGIGVRLSADLINAKAEAIQVRTGIAFDTGITIDEGVKEVKLAGFGFSVDENHVGFSTPFGKIKFNK